MRFAWFLHVGDFGIWPDPDRIDEATRRHDGADDFPRWVAENKPAPRPTLFIKGKPRGLLMARSACARSDLPLGGTEHAPHGSVRYRPRHPSRDLMHGDVAARVRPMHVVRSFCVTAQETQGLRPVLRRKTT